jgi:hypothetical protein
MSVARSRVNTSGGTASPTKGNVMGFTIDTDGMDADHVATLERAEDIKDRTLYDIAWYLVAGNTTDQFIFDWLENIMSIDREMARARAVK